MPLGGCVDIPARPRLSATSRGANCIIRQFYHPLSKRTLILIHASFYVHATYRTLQRSPRASTIEGGHCHDHPTAIRSALSDQRYDGRIPSTIAISDRHPTITGTPVCTPSTPVAPGGHNAGTIWSIGYAGKYLVVQQ